MINNQSRSDSRLVEFYTLSLSQSINFISKDSNLFAGSKLIDVHLEGILESHVDVVGLPTVHGVPQQSHMNMNDMNEVHALGTLPQQSDMNMNYINEIQG